MTLPAYAETLRHEDPDTFLLSLYLSTQQREDVWPLYALNSEIARTRSVVTETQLGHIRLQWWRDRVRDVYDEKTVQDVPVLKVLAGVIGRYKLPQDIFENLIYAREFDLEDRQPAGIDGLSRYAELTYAPLLDLSLRCLGTPHESYKDIAVAYRLTQILRRTPKDLTQAQCYLPVTTATDLYKGRGLERLEPLVSDIVDFAQQRLNQVNGKIPSWLRLHVALTRMYLGQVKALNYNIFSSHMAVPPVAREIRLWWAALSLPFF